MTDGSLFADFTCKVAVSGYHWADGRGIARRSTTRWLTDGAPRNAQWQSRLRRPFEHPALFRGFADIPPTEDGVLAFANEYGLLGAGGDGVLLSDSGELSWGEDLDTWADQITDMRLAINIWDALRIPDVQALQRLVTVDKAAYGYLVVGERGNKPGYHIEIVESQEPELAAQFDDVVASGNLARRAMLFLQQFTDDHISSRLATRLVYLPDTGGLGLRLVPQDLLAALWLQFGRAVESNKEYRQCEACGTWFEVSYKANRKAKRYCDVNCRNKAYRDRQAQQNDVHA